MLDRTPNGKLVGVAQIRAWQDYLRDQVRLGNSGVNFKIRERFKVHGRSNNRRLGKMRPEYIVATH